MSKFKKKELQMKFQNLFCRYAGDMRIFRQKVELGAPSAVFSNTPNPNVLYKTLDTNRFISMIQFVTN